MLFCQINPTKQKVKDCIYTSYWGVHAALFLTYCLNLRDSYCVKTKAFCKRLYV